MGGTPDTWVTPDSDSSCSESAAADTPEGGEASPLPHAASLTGEGVGGGQFAARTVTVRSYPRVRSSPHLPYIDQGRRKDMEGGAAEKLNIKKCTL